MEPTTWLAGRAIPKRRSRPRSLNAEARGWTWHKVSGHAWGKLYCKRHDRDGCDIFIWSTPRVPEHHARQIKRQVDRCPHKEKEANDEDV